MLTSLILLVTVVILLVGLIEWLNTKKTHKKVSTFPGLDPSDPKKGNRDEIAKAGSLHQFLMDLHQKFGRIVSFWMGEEYIVSIASADLFKQHSKFSNRPASLFKNFEPLLMSSSIQYANGMDWKQRRHLYDPTYSHESVTQDHMPIFIQIAEKMMKDLSEIPNDEHIALEKYMFLFALKTILETSFGKSFENDEEVSKLRKSYEVCWSHMEEAMAGVVHDDEDKKVFQEGRTYMTSTIQKVINERRNVEKGTLLIDILLEGDIPDEVVVADAITYVIGGFHTTGRMLTWCVFYLAGRPNIQDKCFEEIVKVLGNETINAHVVKNLKYIRQVLDETMRCSVLAPYAARFNDTDTELGGHIIPAGTPVIHAIGVTLQDGNAWPEPTKFDPDRFKNEPPPYSFVPFGFAGKRKCPGYRFVYMESLVFLSEFLRKFKVMLAPGQEKNVGKVYGLVTKPAEEIFITLEPR